MIALLTLKNMRISRGFTQATLGEMVDVTQQSIQAIETGKAKPSYDTLVKLSKALGCTVDELLGGEEDEPTHRVVGANEH